MLLKILIIVIVLVIIIPGYFAICAILGHLNDLEERELREMGYYDRE